MKNILRLKSVLKEKGISLKEFSEKTDLSYNYCSELARGDKFPRPDTLLVIAEALNVDIRDLFNSTKESEPLNGFIEYNGSVIKITNLNDLHNLIEMMK
jgi:transcriptional regulator with XRE-family HTH domain